MAGQEPNRFALSGYAPQVTYPRIADFGIGFHHRGT
jgi:hypothetical protein